jgi:hypothetical protein
MSACCFRVLIHRSIWSAIAAMPSFTESLRLAFEGKGFLLVGQQQERVNYGVDRDQHTGASDWLASVEYEQVDF